MGKIQLWAKKGVLQGKRFLTERLGFGLDEISWAISIICHVCNQLAIPNRINDKFQHEVLTNGKPGKYSDIRNPRTGRLLETSRTKPITYNQVGYMYVQTLGGTSLKNCRSLTSAELKKFLKLIPSFVNTMDDEVFFPVSDRPETAKYDIICSNYMALLRVSFDQDWNSYRVCFSLPTDLNNKGYPILGLFGKSPKLHRAAYKMMNGLNVYEEDDTLEGDIDHGNGMSCY